MLITAKSTNEAWRKTLKELYFHGNETDNEKYYRDELTIIKIESPTLEDKDLLFPMSQEDITIINEFITTGKNEEHVIHEWTKLYYHRMFDTPFSQIEYFIKKLQEELPVGDSLISMWEREIDQNGEISPCTEVVWGRIKSDKLELHIHAHSSDAYKKLLMNIQEFVTVQHYVAKRLNVEVGNYYHILDSCHIHNKDLADVTSLIKKL